ncbi:MAG: hypothetical protein JWP95_1975, partial [Actinotalea sp.]|nr:hypothetical protein [Actinotalea sp.]
MKKLLTAALVGGLVVMTAGPALAHGSPTGETGTVDSAVAAGDVLRVTPLRQGDAGEAPEVTAGAVVVSAPDEALAGHLPYALPVGQTAIEPESHAPAAHEVVLQNRTDLPVELADGPQQEAVAGLAAVVPTVATMPTAETVGTTPTDPTEPVPQAVSAAQVAQTAA